MSILRVILIGSIFPLRIKPKDYGDLPSSTMAKRATLTIWGLKFVSMKKGPVGGEMVKILSAFLTIPFSNRESILNAIHFILSMFFKRKIVK